MMLISAIFVWTFPNILYQQTVAAENLTVLLRTISYPQNLVTYGLQIPHN